MIGFKVIPKEVLVLLRLHVGVPGKGELNLAVLGNEHSIDKSSGTNVAYPGNLLGIMPGLHIGVCLRRSLICLSIGSLALKFPTSKI